MGSVAKWKTGCVRADLAKSKNKSKHPCKVTILRLMCLILCPVETSVGTQMRVIVVCQGIMLQLKAKFLPKCSPAKKNSFPGQGEGKLLQYCGFSPFFGSRLSYVPSFVQYLYKDNITDTGDSGANAPCSFLKRMYITIFNVSSFHLSFLPKIFTLE